MRRKNAPWKVKWGRSMWPVPLEKWAEAGHGLSCVSYWLPWDVSGLGITFSGVPPRPGERGRRRTVRWGMQNTCVYLPQGLAVLSLSSAPLRGLQAGLHACYFTLHSLASQGSAVQHLFWFILQVLSVNTDSCIRRCFPAREKMTGQN